MRYRGCVKCGSNITYGPFYNNKEDMLEYTCGNCGYSWSTEPLDRAEQDNGEIKKMPKYPRRSVIWMVHWPSMPHDPLGDGERITEYRENKEWADHPQSFIEKRPSGYTITKNTD